MEYLIIIGLKLLRIVSIIFLAIISYYFLAYVSNNLLVKLTKKSKKNKRLKTLRRVFLGTFKFIVLIIGMLMILSEFGLDIAPLLASVGILGLAISMGSREIISDFLSGIFILIDDLIEIGDNIKISGIDGTVTDIDLRKTTLESEDGSIHIIPNGRIKEITKHKTGKDK